MSLAKQAEFARITAFQEKVESAIMRHAVFLLTKVSPTAAEIAWRDYVLTSTANFQAMATRAYKFYAAKPEFYNLADAAAVTDAADSVYLSIVPDLPAALVPPA